MVRAAGKTCMWEGLWGQMMLVASNELPLARSRAGTPWAAHWMAPPVVANLRDAWLGCTRTLTKKARLLHRALREAICVVRASLLEDKG